MPLLNIKTNTKIDELKYLELAEIISTTLDKPIKHVSISIEYVSNFTFQQNNEPTAIAHLKSIGFKNRNEVVKRITDYLAIKCKIKTERIGVVLTNLNRSDVASGGKISG